MNISYSWLKQYIDFSLSPEELGAALTSIGLETGSIERVESVRGGLRGIVIGKVLTCEPHPNSDHLHITTVDLGDGNATQIVCGAPNVAAGQTVVVATVGTTLYDGDKEFQIKKSKIRGVESFGMICAEDEIGIGHAHDGIIVLPDNAATPGTPAAEFYNLTDDYVLEVDLTPNRIDAASHLGVARDLAAWLACHATATPLQRPDASAFHTDNPQGGIPVEVENQDACPRYCGITIRGIKVAESPQWLKDRLTAVGQRPINNIVDITNYILLGIGQPLHCFDLNKIDGGKIVVRTCPEGTHFTTLDGIDRTLNENDLMICNANAPMCIAGVFGGLDSGVTEDTTDIFIESACFHPTYIRKTARRHGLSTDASFRYERGLDPNFCPYALKVAAMLIKELAGGEICGDIVDIYPSPAKPAKVTLDYARMNALIGKEIPRQTVDNILKSLEIEITASDAEKSELLIPNYRVDVTRPCDVTEDILRIYGYNNIEFPDSLHSSLSFKTETDSADDLRRLIAAQLTSAGFNEILNNSLTAERHYTGLTTYPAEKCVHLMNPLSSDLNVMRQTLLFGGLESLSHNINRKASDLMFYETGNVYFFNPESEATAERPLTPYSEAARLALWMTGKSRTGNWARQSEEATYYDLRGHVANIFGRLGIREAEIILTQDAPSDLFATGATIATRSGKHLGYIGMVAQKIAKSCDIKQPVFYAELDWLALVRLSLKKKVTFAALPKTMPVQRDLALLLDSEISFEQVRRVVTDSERKILRDVTLFDVYEGDKLPEGKKSYAISVTLQDPEKTLQDKHIEQVMNKIITNLQKQLGAQLR